MKVWLLSLILMLSVLVPAKADYLIKDGAGANRTVKSGTGPAPVNAILPSAQPTDPTGTPIMLSAASVPINISTATTTALVAPVSGNSIVITSWDVVAGGSGAIQLVYGTGSNCSGGQQPLTGAYPLTAQAGIAKGDGSGVVLRVPQGNGLCALTNTSQLMSGSVSYVQGSF